MNFFYDQSRNLLVYQPPSQFHADAILQRIPEARGLNGQYVAVPATLQNSQTLRWMNWPVTPVMTDANYNWPIAPPWKPYASQKITANFLVLHPRSFNLSDMGVGKTLATLWAADWLMQREPGMRAIIVAPLSILQRVWGDAIFQNFLSRRTFDILYGDAERRLKILQESKADFLIINFDGVKVGTHFRRKDSTQRKRMELDGLSAALARRDDIRIAIVDEASGYRDDSTDRHHVARQVIGTRPYLWLLTGTPTPNAPTDAYGLAKLVNNAFGKSFTTFREESMMKLTQFKWVPRRDGYDKARTLLTPSIRFDIKDVWDGPPASTQQREVPLTDKQKTLMAELKKKLQVTLKAGQPITIPNEASARTKFLQISLGAIYDDEHDIHLTDAEPRLREAENVLEQTDRKVVIFIPLTSVLNLVYKRLSKKWTGVILNGPVTPKQRAENIRRFAEDETVKFVAADPGTTAHGINEFALVADTVLWFAPTDKNELYLQGNKRVNRPGQKYPMTFVQLVSNPLEREIYRRLETNTSLQGVLLNMIAKGEI